MASIDAPSSDPTFSYLWEVQITLSTIMQCAWLTLSDARGPANGAFLDQIAFSPLEKVIEGDWKRAPASISAWHRW